MNKEFSFPKQKIIDVVNGLPDDIRTAYPEHIFEPERIEIARELVLKEYYKLFPSLTAEDFSRMGDDIIYWLDGRKDELAPVHDYWNYLDGMMISLKLKDIVPLLTSDHILWKQEIIDPKLLTLYWPVGSLSEHSEQRSYDYEFIKSNIIDNPSEFEKNKQISDQKATDTVVSRDEYPILILRQLDGSLSLLDGNRRVMRAWLHDASQLNAWIGTVTDEPLLHEQWVGTGFLRRLLSQYANDPRPEVAESVRSQLEILFATSSIARYHYQQRCMRKPYAAELAEGLLG